ncbi:MAG: hypothetical protein ACRCSK_08520 [Fusobacteriaceae bacterium]
MKIKLVFFILILVGIIFAVSSCNNVQLQMTSSDANVPVTDIQSSEDVDDPFTPYEYHQQVAKPLPSRLRK